MNIFYNSTNKYSKKADFKLISLLTVFLSIVFIVTLNSRQLVSGDETRVAGISAQTAVYGNWAKPELNGKDFLEKPPLFFWADALSIKLFKNTPLGARLPSALMAIIGALSIFIFMKKMKYSDISAFSSSVILATSAQYWEYGHKCMIDMMLAVFIGIALLAFKTYCNANSGKEKLLYFMIYTAGLAGGLMSKGLIGIAIPISAIGAYLFFTHIWLRKPEKWSTWIVFILGVILSFIPFSIWILVLYKEAGYNAVYRIVWTNNFGRFTGSHAEHIEPVYYYLLKIFEQLQPWTIILPIALWFHFKQIFKEKKKNSLFFLCALIIPYVMLSMAAGKRQVYILPLYAFEAILIGSTLGHFWDWNKQKNDKFKLTIIIKFLRNIFPVIFTITGVVCIVLSILKELNAIWLIIPSLLIIFSLISLILNLKKHSFAMPLLFIAFGFLFASIDCVFMNLVNNKYSYIPLFTYVKNLKEKGEPIVLLQAHERLRGAAVFYLGEKIPEQTFKQLKNNIQNNTINKNIYIYNGGKQVRLPEKINNMKIIKNFKVGKKYQLLLKNMDSQ